MELKVGFPTGVPLGGIGTDLVELLTDGRPGALLINNNWAQPLTETDGCFFAIRVAPAGGNAAFRLLQSEGYAGFPGVTRVRYSGLFPVAQAEYLCADLPVQMAVTAFSPLVPHDVARSNFPGAVFLFKFRNLLPARIHLRLFVSYLDHHFVA